MGCELLPNEISALIGGGLTVLGIFIGLGIQYLIDEGREQKIIQGFLQAVQEDITILWDEINEATGDLWKKFEKEKKEGKIPIFSSRISVSPDYLIIYSSNANLIGRVKNSNLRRKIVKVYTSFQALIEGYKMNSRVLNECREAVHEGNHSLYSKLNFELRDNAPELKEKHDDFAELMEDFLEMLEKELSQCKEWDFRSSQR